MHGVIRLVPSVSEAFADLMADEITRAEAGYALFLSGGGTASTCYRALADRAGLPWENIDVYLGDERCVPPDDPDSNHRMISEVLLDVVGPLRGDHPMYVSGDPAAAATAYQRLVGDLARLDLVHLGLGPDGHTASLFPGSTAEADSDPTHLVVTNTDPIGRNPHERLTLTYTAIARATRTVITVEGAGKHDALARIMVGEDLPAARVSGSDVLWLVDADALGDATPDEVG